MTTLLEARHVTKVFGGGVFDRNTTVALEDFSISHRQRPALHHRRGGGERQRQDDAWPACCWAW